MYTRIKELADSAVALQNKLNMEAALREIGSLCNMMLDSVSLASAPLADANIDMEKVKTGIKSDPIGGFVSGEALKPAPAKKAAKK